MAKEVRLQKLGQTMEEGTVVSILVKDGDEVKKGDVIFEIETDKATMEMDSPVEGFVKKILVGEGQTVPVGAALIILGSKDETVSADFVSSLGGGQAVAAAAAEPVKKEAAGQAAAPKSAKVVRLQKLGQTMEEGTVVSILIKEGDNVKKGDVIFEIETDKATMEMDSPVEGFVKKVLVRQGQVVPVNDALVVLADKDEQIPDSFISSLAGGAAPAAAAQAEAPKAKAEAVKAEAPKAAAAEVKAEPMAAGRVFASPRAKMTAAELGVDIAKVQPANGIRIVEADIRKAGSGKAVAAPAAMPQMPTPTHKLGDKLPVSKFQKITAQKMLQSKQEIPCFYLNVKVDVTEMVKLRNQFNEKSAVKVAFNDFIIKAVGMGLKQFPEMTGQLKDGFIQLAGQVNVGLAISVSDGLAAPLVRDVESKSVIEIAEYSKALIARTKAGNLGVDDVEGGCITISNLGGFGIDSFIPIVVPGQCSIIGVGKIADTCVPVDGNILVRKIMDMTLSVDHKVANGANAAQFLDYVRKLLENPAALL